jgi:hypothetical protein
MKNGLNTVSEAKDAISKLSENEKGELLDWLEIHLGTREMVEQVIRLTQCHTIWWKISNKEDVKIYNEAFLEHLHFFEPVGHLLLWQGFFTVCYQLFDDHRDAKHILFRIEQLARTDALLANKLRKRINDFKVLNKIKTIRHKVSAHREKSRSPQKVVKDTALVVKELKEVVAFTQDIVSTLVEALGGEKKSSVLQKFSDCESSAHDGVFQVMEVLAKPFREISE